MKYGRFKRGFDIVIAAIVLLTTFPLFVCISVAIKLDSPGPVLFVQQRLGRDGRMFPLLKFRSMKAGTPEVATDLLPDPGQYETRIGKLLRRTSLDEYPQLINILLGTMSLVGPRPSLHNQTELNESRIRLGITAIRPGLTGYAQINGRDYIADKQKLEYDLHYLKTMSFSMDLYIIGATFGQVIKGKNIKRGPTD